MYRVDPLSHTADVGYEVAADSPEELFRGAAAGLVRTLLERDEVPPSGTEDVRDDGGRETIELERPDRERLMVAWLRELLYRISRGGRLPAEIALEMPAPTDLRARIRWAAPDPDAPLIRDVKGITYHGLRVEEDPEGTWHARLVLDV